MTIQHKDLTGTELHEPKGVESATSGQTYVADGVGSGEWSNPLSSINNLNSFTRDLVIDDLSTTGSNAFISSPANCTLSKITGVLQGPITVADAVISLYREGILLGQTLVIPFAGSGIGVDTILTLSPTYDLTEGQVLEFRSDGGSTDAQKLHLTLLFIAT